MLAGMLLRLNYLRLVKLPLMLFVLAACPGTAEQERVCETNTSRCADATRPQVCVSTGRWQDTAREPCAESTACCLIAGIAGRPIHACAPADGSRCLPESTGQPAYAPPAEPTPTARDRTAARPETASREETQ